MDELQKASFQIIAAVGMARSSYIEAVAAAKTGDFDKAEELMKAGDEQILKGHDAHTELIQREAGGWRWLFFSLFFNTALAYVVSVAAYQIGLVVWN